ncbi:DUF3060 domain-containing protein [Mycobacterium spongiae]|uniref:DUF3060 domain-containing protein n=1 Tax=Mycobacterium spongiae TaxID=886343 RepID=A0A975PVF4_9MYCO|nr:DUF3060 domain-containing protein [Mycobacterium spongiae]QUR66055.1 DUF3060 domain-containing protein [Mycobacterium spongiae]
MNPEDDPEARIRELERPLADVARASEIGSTQPGDYSYSSDGYTYPPAPPPPSYGSPFPGATPRSSTGNRVWWIVAAVGVFGVLALVGGIAAFTARQLSGDGVISLSPSPSAPGATAWPKENPPGSPPSDRGTATPTAGPATSLPPLGGRLSVSGVNADKTIVCNDSIVTVSGMSNTVIITGHCATLTVSGMQNSVTVDSSDTIIASGLNNQVTYHSGAPKITKSGRANVVEQG